MKKEKILNELNDRINQISNSKKKKCIQIILKNKNWYNDIDIDMFLNILFDLGYNKESSLKIYKILITS